MHKFNDFDYVEDSFQAYLVAGAEFTPIEEYPIIRNDMVPSTIPSKILPFSKAIHYKGDLSNITVCFYSADKTFERIRRNPKRYLGFFKKQLALLDLTFRSILICR